MRALLFLFAMSIGASAAAEGAIKLRAGEHSDFSRIVVPDLDQQWSVLTSGRKVEVIFSGETPEFDLSDLTEKHKAYRVQSANVSMRGEQRVLFLTLACDCSVRTAQNYSKAIIIDIYDAKPIASAPPQPIATVTKPVEEPVTVATDNVTAGVAGDAVTEIAVDAAAIVASDAAMETAENETQSVAADAVVETTEDAAAEAAVDPAASAEDEAAKRAADMAATRAADIAAARAAGKVVISAAGEPAKDSAPDAAANAVENAETGSTDATAANTTDKAATGGTDDAAPNTADNAVADSTDDAPEKPTPENLIAARDRMIALLAEARSRGVVQTKTDDDEANLLDALAQAEEEKKAAEAAAREETNEPVVCIDPALFTDRPQEARDYSTIMALREKVDSAVGEERIVAGRELAGAYLRIGFFEEASAVARSTTKKYDGELALIAGFAELSVAANVNATDIFEDYVECGPTYLMLAAAARAQNGDNYTAALSGRQIDALNALMRSLRGPIAEIFALNAVDHEEFALLGRFYEIASRARAPGRTPALAIIEAALPDPSNGPVEIDEPLMELARTPGPMQARALGELAVQYERDATIAYEGFLEDISAQSSRTSGSPGTARATIAGAKALASAGHINESIELLDSLATSSAQARRPAGTLARSILMDALAGENDITRFLAIDAFLQYAEFLTKNVAPDDALTANIARELAKLGSAELTDQVVGTASHQGAKSEASAIQALARLNSGADDAALALAEKRAGNSEATIIAIRAAERLGKEEVVTASVKRALQRGAMNKETAAAAWQIGEWQLAADAYAMLAPEDADDGLRYALAALMTGAEVMPEDASRALASDPAALEASQNMFASAPEFSLWNLGDADAFSDGVAKETARIRERLNDE